MPDFPKYLWITVINIVNVIMSMTVTSILIKMLYTFISNENGFNMSFEKYNILCDIELAFNAVKRF